MTQIPVRVEFIRNPVTRTDVKITPVYWGKDEEDALAFERTLRDLLAGYFEAMWTLARHDPKEIVVPSWGGWTFRRDFPKVDPETGLTPTWIDIQAELEQIADGASHRLIRVFHGLGGDGETLVTFGRDGSIACSGGWEPVIEDGKIIRFERSDEEAKKAKLTPNQLRQLQDALNALLGDAEWKNRIIVLPGECDE